MRRSTLHMATSGRLLVGLCLFMVAILSCPGPVAKESREQHVAVSGSDTRGDGTVQKPWRTIVFAVSRMKGGGIVTIHGGTYREGYIRIPSSASGSREYPTTIRAAEGEEVTIYGVDRQSKDPYTMGVHDASYVTIEGLRIMGQGRGGGGVLFISGSQKPCTHVTIKNCDLIDSGTNFGAHNPSVVVFNYTDNCEISNCRIYGFEKCDRTGIKIWSGTSRLLVQGNEVFNLLRKGIDNKHGGRDKHLIIRNNYVHDIGHMGIHLNGDNSLVEHNVLYRCQIGIGVWRNEGSPGGSHSRLDHNTLVNCGSGIYLGFGPAGPEGFRNCTVTNNIVMNCKNRAIPELSITPYGGGARFDFGHTIDYNCYFNDRYTDVIRDHKRKFTLDGWRNFSGQDAHSVQRDPGLLGAPDSFSDLCGFQVGEGFARSFKTSDGRVVGAGIAQMANCANRLPPGPSNVSISTP